MGNTQKFFEGKIEKLSTEELEALYKKIATGLKFNFYEIDDELDVFVAFEVMNNRGKPLSTLELLKNRLIYLTTLLDIGGDDKARLRKDINEAWKTVYEYLGKNKDNPLDDDDFLRNHWIMYFKYERSRAGAFRKFLLKSFFTSKNILDEKAKTKIGFNEIKNYVDSISKSVKVWFDIFNPQYSNFCDETKGWLAKLNRVGFGAFAPLIMAAVVKGIDEDDLIGLLKSSERFVFLVFRITRRPSHTKNNYFYRTANELYYGKKPIEVVIEDIDWMIDGEDDYYYYGWYDLNKFVDYIGDKFNKEQGFYSWNGLRYFLFEYELYLQKKAKGAKKTTWENAKSPNSIEHIYPQDAKEKCWTKKFRTRNQQKKEYILHSLGNLLLLSQSKNSELQNKCFQYKKKHTDKNGNETGYFNGSYSEIEVSQSQDWTPNDILERGKYLLEFMEERWEIEIEDKMEILHL